MLIYVDNILTFVKECILIKHRRSPVRSDLETNAYRVQLT